MTAYADEQEILGSAACLGAELRRLRIERGLSQRQFIRLIGLTAHSNLSDYERGRRIPPGDIVVSCERLLRTEAGYLQRLRAEAVAERARRRKEQRRARRAGSAD